MGYAADNPALSTLNTDMYQLTMSQVWFDQGTHEDESVYYLHWRKPPLGASYTCVAGLEEANDFLNRFGFSEDDIEFLRSITDEDLLETIRKESPVEEANERVAKARDAISKRPIVNGRRQVFSNEYLDYLSKMKLSLDVAALREGEVMTSEAPVIRITGPRIQGQFVESPLLQIMNSNSIIATRASVLSEATENQPVADFSLRRAANIAMSVSRSSYIGGVLFTASLYAAKMLGITPTGTMAHAYIMSFQQDGIPNEVTELRAFETYMKSMPTRTVMLVDTYSVEQGVRNAIQASINTGIPLKGVRLDSGDIFVDAWMVKEMLDEAAKKNPHLFGKTKIFATDGLDEKKISEFKQRSIDERGEPFPVTVWGVGTNLGNPGPFNGGVYKICARVIEQAQSLWQRCMKVAGVNEDDAALPSSKASIPGVELDVLRLWKDGKIVADIVVDTSMDIQELLKAGKAIKLSDNKTEIAIPAYDEVTTLLVPVFKRNEQGISEFVFQGPPTKVLDYNPKAPREVTDLDYIRNFHLAQKAALPDEVRRAVKPEKLLVLIDPRIQQERINIIAKTNAEQKPHHEVSSDDRLTVEQSSPNQARA